MSAVNIFPSRAAISVLSDALYYEASGVVRGFGSKVILYPELTCVAACRGDAGVISVLGGASRTAQSIDHLFKGLTESLERLVDAVRVHDSSRLATVFDAEISVAGWSSDHNQFGHWLMPLSEKYGDAAPAWRFTYRGQSNAIAPGLSDFQPPAEFDCRTSGLDLLKRQRHLLWPAAAEGAGQFHAVGGFAQLTIVTQDKVTSEIIHRWPDKIGERIVGEAATKDFDAGRVGKPSPTIRRRLSRRLF